MNQRTTWLLAGLAVCLFLFIVLVERHAQTTSMIPEEPPRLLSLRASEVTNIQLRVTNQLVVKVEKTNGDWHLTLPIYYPAQNERIARLLEILENLHSQKLISLAELAAENRTVADFGLDVPQMALAIQHGGQRSEILFGSKTALGDQVYVQMLASPDIYIIGSELFDRLPRNADDWRDRSLLTLNGLVLDRLEVRAPGRGFALVLDPTNKVFYLSKPTPARADNAKVQALLRNLAAGRIVKFVTDTPGNDLEAYGLQPPAVELALGQGTNDLFVVQFGKSPTNDASLVYARRLSHNNIVLVRKTLLETLLTSHDELRDRQLLTFNPEQVDRIEVTGTNGFGVHRQTNSTWTTTGATPLLVDAELVRDWLDRLSRLQGTVEKDVVTDFAPYGLAQPGRQIVLSHLATLADGKPTNQVIAQLDLGNQEGEKLFVRRPDENSAYYVAVEALRSLPNAAWQLRDRRVFHFSTNQVASVTVRQHGYERKLLRSPAGNWSLAPGSQGVINTFAVEDMVDRLSELQANAWVARGDENRARYGFKDDDYRLTLELKDGDKPETRVLEFAQRESSRPPLASTTIDGQTWIFDFPVMLYYRLISYLSNPPLPPSPPPH